MNPTQTTTPTNPMSPTNGTNFSLNTTAPGSTVLGGNNTFNSVMNYRDTLANKLQSQYQDYNHSQSPLYDQYAQTTQFSPGYLSAYNQNLNDNQAYRQGTLNIRGEVKPMEFLTGEQQQLDLQHSIKSQANAENLNYMEMLRKNNLDSLQARIGFNQQQYQDQTQATQAGLNYGQTQAGLVLQQQQQGIAQQQVGIAQQQANQGRYDYQQIIDPNTGFPQIVTIDKQTGQPVNTAGAGTIGGAPGAPGTQGAGSAAMNVMKNLGVQQDLPLNQVVQAYGVDPLVNAIIQNEGGSVKGVQNNPGNIKFRGLPGQTDSGIKASDGGTFANYTSQDAGKAAIAAIVTNAANGKSSVYGAAPTLTGFMNKYTNTGPMNNTPSVTPQNSSAPSQTLDAQYQNIINSAPTPIKNAIKQLPDGTPYIDSGQISGANFMTVAQAYAGKTGVRMLSAEDAKSADSAKQAISNLNVLSNMFSQLAPTSGASAKIRNITDIGSQFLDTDFGSQIKAFNSNRETLLQQIRTLAQSSPRLNGTELELAANSMPKLSTGNKDTLKDGVNKLVLTQNYLDNAIRAINPSYIGSPVSIGGQYAIMGPDGKAYQFPSRDAALQALQVKNTIK